MKSIPRFALLSRKSLVLSPQSSVLILAILYLLSSILVPVPSAHAEKTNYIVTCVGSTSTNSTVIVPALTNSAFACWRSLDVWTDTSANGGYDGRFAKGEEATTNTFSVYVSGVR